MGHVVGSCLNFSFLLLHPLVPGELTKNMRATLWCFSGLVIHRAKEALFIYLANRRSCDVLDLPARGVDYLLGLLCTYYGIAALMQVCYAWADSKKAAARVPPTPETRTSGGGGGADGGGGVGGGGGSSGGGGGAPTSSLPRWWETVVVPQRPGCSGRGGGGSGHMVAGPPGGTP
jgi:uncharacterized membrane protein YgcG